MTTVYCDESVWMPVAKGLRQRGWEVKTATEKDRLGEPDREQLLFAVSNDYVLLTFDDDFLSLVERENMDHSGIVYVNQTGKRIGEVVKRVDKILQSTENIDRIHHV